MADVNSKTLVRIFHLFNVVDLRLGEPSGERFNFVSCVLLLIMCDTLAHDLKGCT